MIAGDENCRTECTGRVDGSFGSLSLARDALQEGV
jgi:hypothetical protein